MNIPSSLFYTEDHEWVRIEGEIAYIGITDFAQSELGDIVYVEVSTEGEQLNAGDIFGTVEAVKTTSDLYMPIAGKVMEFNTALNNSPELVNKDPYGEGWIIKAQTASNDHSHLLDSQAYEKKIGG
jgi:glycine cleavage system H protein